MSTELRVTLPPDGTSPAAARREVRAACEQAGATEHLDDALLLVTELVTNAVVHAGTLLELAISVSQQGLRIEVSDGSPGGVPAPAETVDEGREGGRGLFLLDALASSWGSTHHRTGKSLWFCLDDSEQVPRSAPTAPTVVARELQLADLGWLLSIGDRVAELGAVRVVDELLHRFADGLGASYVALLQPQERDSWVVSTAVGAVPEELATEEVRRAADEGRAVVLHGDLVLAVDGAGGTGGAVVLGAGALLDENRVALARLAVDRMGALLQQESSRSLALRDRGALALLAEASEMFAGALDVTLATTLLCQLVVPRFGSWAALYGTAEQGARLLASCHVDEQLAGELQVRLSTGPARALVDSVAATSRTGHPTLLDGRSVPPALVDPTSELLAVPLLARRRVLGVLLLARSAGREGLVDDLGVLAELTRRAALAIEGARLYEERSAVAQALQASLLPPELPVVEGIEFGARYAAAGEGNEVGGDFYDVFQVSDREWAVAIGDVCGKGPEAATITGLARNVLRLMVEEGRSPDAAFRRLNGAILDLGDRGRFLTAALALLRLDHDGIHVQLATAGHPPPVHVSASGQVRFVGAGGTLLGVTPEIDIAVEELLLAPGEQLVLYTDGVTERRDGPRWFGEDTLESALARSAGRSPDAVAGFLEQQVRGFASAPASDDLAVLVVGAGQPVAGGLVTPGGLPGPSSSAAPR
jgi:sigma-B regulation protein RsbU (phosphoserine phosphatase)